VTWRVCLTGTWVHLRQQSSDAKIAQLIDYITYMQQRIEDTNTITNRKIADLQAKVSELEG